MLSNAKQYKDDVYSYWYTHIWGFLTINLQTPTNTCKENPI